MATAHTTPRTDAWTKPSLRRLLEQRETFVTCAELVTSRGLITERRGRKVLSLARALAEHPQVHALSITDNPGGNAMLSADTLGTDLISRGQEVIIHLSCKDWNRNALQSRGWKLASEGFDNVLALSGDCPTPSYQGQAAGVFDIDSIGLLRMYSDMNAGVRLSNGDGRPEKPLEQTNFFLGAVVNNYKQAEREVMPQYFKLAKKVENGAAFIINQIGYDSRKQDELLKYMRMHELNVSVLANVYVLSVPAARFFHAGNIPGVVLPDDLLRIAEGQAASPDRGKAFFLELAAKQCAVARGLGFRGVYLGGHLRYKDYEKILSLAAGFAEDDWKQFAREILFHQPEEFYYFEPDPETELSSTEVNRQYAQSKTPEGLRATRKKAPIAYKVNRLAHDKLFEKGTLAFRAGRAIYERVERAGHGVRAAMHGAEQALKIAAFDCEDCGDCSLPEIAFLCPESQCVKNQRNGPCGGTRPGGKCEVGEKDCIWSRAYDRLKGYGEEDKLIERPVVFRDGALKGTSAWANTFLERDHHAKVNRNEDNSE